MGSLTGTVRLADSKAPAVGVNVVLQKPPLPELQGLEEFIIADPSSPGEFHGMTDASGSFVITNIRPGEYYVVPYLAGYLSAQDYIFPGAFSAQIQGEAGVPGFLQKVVVRSNSESHIHLRMERGGAIEGSVSWSSGPTRRNEASPAIWPTEIALNLSVKGKDGQFRRALGASHPDQNGHYRFEAVPGGTYIVFAALPGGMVRTDSGTLATSGPLFFFGDTVRRSQARQVEVSGTGTRTGIDIMLPVTGFHTVRGKVEMPDGKLVNTGVVELFPIGEQDAQRANPLGVDGSFQFDQVLSGAYTVLVEDPPQFEFAGLAAGGRGIRMKRKKTLYMPASQDVLVADQDPPLIVLRPRPAR